MDDEVLGRFERTILGKNLVAFEPEKVIYSDGSWSLDGFKIIMDDGSQVSFCGCSAQGEARLLLDFGDADG